MLLWMVMLAVMLLFLGGLSLDLWRAFSERRALAGLVDAAAVAGASGIDVQAWRAGEVVQLDPALAEARARASAAAQTDTAPLTSFDVQATPAQITVVATGEVELTLTRLLLADRAPLQLSIAATSGPMLSP